MNTKKMLSIILAVLLMFSAFTVNVFALEAEDSASDYYHVDESSRSTTDEGDLPTPDEGSATYDEEPDRLLGDADFSGSVNVKDATLIRKYIADLSTLDEFSWVYADVDRNEDVNIKDATIIQKYVADIYVKESVGWPYDANPETYRYYFYMPEDWLNEYTAKTGNTAGIYWWDGTNSHRAWPGIPAKKGDVEGVYYYDVPKDVTTIIWNNFLDGGADNEQPEYYKARQTRNVPTEYYDPLESEFYPEGTRNFDGMIYVIDPELYPYGDYNLKMVNCGEWFYYYGNGEYGTAPIRGDSKILTGDTVDLTALSKDNAPTETYRYYFYMPEQWENKETAKTGNTAGIYWWEGTAAKDAWPGIPAHKADAEGVYYYDVPKDVTTIVWNNYVDGGADHTQPIYYYASQTRNIGTEYYEPGESDLYPNGTENFDNMIYIVNLELIDTSYCSGKHQLGGEWYYYYGNGEYGTSKVKGESEILTERVINSADKCPWCGRYYKEPEKTYRYYFYLPEDWLNESTATTGNTAGIYWWEGTGYHDGWPGVPAKQADAEGVYYYDVPVDVTTIMWNNYFDGGADSSAPHYNDSHMTIEIGTEFYYPGESGFYPEGLKNFDGMIYVVDREIFPNIGAITRPFGIGEWFYYYGDGEYGTSPQRGESRILTGSTIDYDSLLLDNNPPDTYRYFFYMPPEWLNDSTEKTGNTAGIYWWEGTGAQARYPGKKAIATEVEGVYYCDVPTDVTNVIWNNFFDGGDDVTAPYYVDAIPTRDINVDGYDPGQSKNYPEGLETFDGMIFVTDFADYDYNDYSGKLQFGGEWFYYYGDGKYGTSPQRGESEIFTDYALNNDPFILDNEAVD